MSDDNLSLTKAIQRAHGITAKDINSYIDALEKEIASLKDRLADQVVQVLAYKILVSELDEEIASLKELVIQATPYVEYAVKYSTPLSQKLSEEWLEKVQERREN